MVITLPLLGLVYNAFMVVGIIVMVIYLLYTRK
jgi:hypothetical protein